MRRAFNIVVALVLACALGQGCSCDAVRIYIQADGGAVPPPGSKIEVRYFVACELNP